MKDLEALCGQSFDAVIDYNSKLPGAVLDDGTPFLNHIQAPFYNYILDHPVYHHANLSVLLENYHVICIDDDHNKYISKCIRILKVSIPCLLVQLKRKMQ